MEMPSLEKIVEETLSSIEDSKIQIYDIAENARSESERIKRELQEIQHQVSITIEKVDNLERLEKAARRRLMQVSRDFNRYSEEEVRQAYEKAKELQVELALLREREHQLRLRRADLEKSLRRLMLTVDKAEGLVTQVGVVLDYLGGNLKWINSELEVVNQKRLLAPKIIQAQEEERRRVAREIHDGPAQSMANLVLRTEVCEKLIDIDKEKVREELRGLRNTVKNSLQDVRRIIFDLRPMALDDLGLEPAITRYLEKLKQRYDLNIDINCFMNEERIEPILEVALYRVIQESVQNTIKHASAANVKVCLECGEHQIRAIVRDDGIGFDVKNVYDKPKPDNYGILGMKERVEILGGQLFLRSNTGEGTEVLVILPIETKEIGI